MGLLRLGCFDGEVGGGGFMRGWGLRGFWGGGGLRGGQVLGKMVRVLEVEEIGGGLYGTNVRISVLSFLV